MSKKYSEVYFHDGALHSNKDKQAMITQNIVEPHRHYVEWKNTNTNKHIYVIHQQCISKTGKTNL